MGVEAELSVDDDAVDVDVIGGGHGEDLVGLDDLVVLGEVEEGVGDAPGHGEGVALGDGLLVVYAKDYKLVAELLADSLEVRHLFEAEVAPAGPEVDDNGLLAEEGVQAYDLAGGVDEHEVGCGVSDVGADLVITLAEVGVVGSAEHDHGAVLAHDGWLRGEGVVEGDNDGRNTGQSEGEDYPLLKLSQCF